VGCNAAPPVSDNVVVTSSRGESPREVILYVSAFEDEIWTFNRNVGSQSPSNAA